MHRLSTDWADLVHQLEFIRDETRGRNEAVADVDDGGSRAHFSRKRNLGRAEAGGGLYVEVQD